VFLAPAGFLSRKPKPEAQSPRESAKA
jgi:hypothetical protein